MNLKEWFGVIKEKYFTFSTKNNADSMWNRTSNSIPPAMKKKDKDLEDETDFAKDTDDLEQPDIKLNLKNIYSDMMKGEDD